MDRLLVRKFGLASFIYKITIILCIWNIGGNDYTPGPYTVTFPIGTTNASFVVSISDDTFEDNENFNVTIDRFVLSNDVVIGNYGQATVMIIDDDRK